MFQSRTRYSVRHFAPTELRLVCNRYSYIHSAPTELNAFICALAVLQIINERLPFQSKARTTSPPAYYISQDTQSASHPTDSVPATSRDNGSCHETAAAQVDPGSLNYCPSLC